jgi:hypothetical protein
MLAVKEGRPEGAPGLRGPAVAGVWEVGDE